VRPITLEGFADKFSRDPDPWNTWTGPDEVLKRRAILHALPAGKVGRLLELGAGNGSNSQALAQRSLRLDATEATCEGVDLVAKALRSYAPRAQARRLVVPVVPMRGIYDAIVIAELLYYLPPGAMAELAHQVAAVLRPGGTLVLAHHRITFYDFAQIAEHIQSRFLTATGQSWCPRTVRRTGRWTVLSCERR
jgi:cyclopropane fatty-acyl-phospholipid synthase-like methyltransferase